MIAMFVVGSLGCADFYWGNDNDDVVVVGKRYECLLLVVVMHDSAEKDTIEKLQFLWLVFLGRVC